MLLINPSIYAQHGDVPCLVLSLLLGRSALPASWLQHCWTVQLQVLSPALVVSCFWKLPFHGRWGCDSVPFLGVDLSSRAGKTLHLRIQIRQVCIPLSSCSECIPSLVLQMSKGSDWDYDMGTADMNLSCQDPCAGSHSPSHIVHHSHIPVVEPCNPHGARSE